MKLTLVLMLIYNISLFAQDGYQLSGTVLDQGGMPIPGANVIVANTSKGAATDFDGKFQIVVKSGDVLNFSFIGYVSQSVTITNQKTLNINLVEDASQLDEVVVVGYGTRKKSHLTGAVAKVGGDDVAAIQATRVDDALAGKLAGVLIQNQSGEPGADPKIQIRAASSLSGDSGPLIVVDGYPISGSLATVNPNDIESLEVLKDAASAAIYGSRGANGVILVTTKKGKQGKASFNYNAYTSFSSKYIDNIKGTAAEWADIADANIANGTFDVSQVDPATLAFRHALYRDSPNQVAVEDWLFQNGSTQSHNFSMSGGTEDVNYFASVGYQDTEGIVRTQDFERLNARLNVDAKLGDKFKAGVSFNGFTSDRTLLAHDMRDLLRAYSVHPVIHTEASIAYVQQLDQEWQNQGGDSFDSDITSGSPDSATEFNSSIYTLEPGDYAHDWHYGGRSGVFGGSSNQGPGAKLLERSSTEKTYFANISSYLQYQIIDGLNIKTVLGGDMRDTETNSHQLSQAHRSGEISQTRLNETNTKRSSVLSETTLNYAAVLNDKHDISAVVGIEFQNLYTTAIGLVGTSLPSDEPLNYSLLDPANITVSERDETIARESVFGRVNYAYDDRYLLSASIRRDGDSRFGKNQRYETFPAVSLGWNVHNEAFWDSEAVSLLKLRVSTGSLGTTSFLGAYNSLSLLNPATTAYGNGYLIPSDIENSDLTWQTNTETNYGVDLGLMNNRLRLGIDYYTSDTEDMLIQQSVSEVLGTSAINLNSGDVRSSGFEFEMNFNAIRNDNFSWSFSGNLSTVETEVTDLGDLEALPDNQYGTSGRGPTFRNYVGGEIGEMWGYETTGEVEMVYMSDPTEYPYKESGYSYAVDQNEDGVINSEDLVKIGQSSPDFYWGMSHNFSYKDFDLSLQFQGAQGGDVYNLDPLYYGSQWGRTLQPTFDTNLDNNDNTRIADHNGQHVIRNRDGADSMIQDASYVALRNMTIGYTLNSDIAEKVGLSSVRIYAAATNLLYFTSSDYTSYNPEGVLTANQGGDTYQGPLTYGVQLGSSPTVRSFTFGLNVNF
ncbi:TonB-dependent receptor [Postechiella marina]